MSSSDMDNTFITRQNRKPTTFETKYLDSIGYTGDKRIGLPGLSPQLVDKQQEMEKVNNELEEARVKFESWKTKLQIKKKEIEVKKEKLADEKRQLDSFTQVNTVDLKKCKDREQQELKQAAKMELELEELTQEEEELRKKNDELQAELTRLQPCATYLQSVVDKCHQFDNVDSILYRHDSLSHTRAEYLVKYQNLMKNLGVEEQEAERKLMHEKNLLIESTMNYNMGLMAIDQAKKVNEYRKTTLIKDIQRVEDKSVELAMIRTSIRTIYARALQKTITRADAQKRNTETKDEDLMLNYIQNRFTDLLGIIEEWKKETVIH